MAALADLTVTKYKHMDGYVTKETKYKESDNWYVFSLVKSRSDGRHVSMCQEKEGFSLILRRKGKRPARDRGPYIHWAHTV